jgi:hypothetical protein
MDLPATLATLQEIRARSAALIASEASYLRQNRVGLVLADIPPLAAPIAHAAGVPCWMMSNFGWDFIYRDWGDEFLDLANWMSDCFAQCDRLFRLPFHEPMTAFPVKQDVGLTGGNPRFPAEAVVAALGLTDRPKGSLTLMTFGGLGLAQVPYENVNRFPDRTFLCFDPAAPALPNLINVDDRQFRPVDLIPCVGRILSKPGYSTFSEACRFDLPIVGLVRAGFAEAPLLLEGIRDCMPHQVITPAEFFEGDWEFLNQPLLPPRTDRRLPKDGNQTIAQAVVDYFTAHT